MALTLLEAAKRRQAEPQRSAIIEIYARESDILRALPFENVQGGGYRYNREQTLPGIGFRGINEAYSESTGVINPLFDPLVIAGGDLDVDKFIIATQGVQHRAIQEAMKVKSLAQTWGHKIIKGDSTTDPREFDGLQKRLTGNQLVAAGSTSGGDALSLYVLDTAIRRVDMPTHLLMSKAMHLRFLQASRNTSVSGYIVTEKDAFGRPVMMYNGLEILIADENGDVFQTLAFDEANPGGGSAVGTSIYVLRLAEGYLQGIQNEDMNVTDLGEQDAKPVLRTRVEWFSGITMQHPRAASRVWGIKDAAIVA